MFKINENYLKLQSSYLFSTIAKKISIFAENNKDKNIIRLGIGDVTKPLAPCVVEAMKAATVEMGEMATFRGYGPEQGYDFLRELIVKNDFEARGVKMLKEEIFVSDGSKSDCGNILDIFSCDNIVAVCDPVYPVYVDTNVMKGTAGDFVNGHFNKLVYMPATKGNGFCPEPPKGRVDIIYLCYPNNPTGLAANYSTLKMWVDYALKNGSIILYDAAYEAFITEDIPHSIFEIPGAEACAIEFRSFSKKAGFTGTRCGYTVIKKELVCGNVSINSLWNRRQTTKFNGTAYVVQKGAAAVYSDEGKAQTQSTINYYLNNAKVISDGLKGGGMEVYGGVNAPYIWLKTPNNMTSWEFFDFLLEKANVVGTPGSGFGPSGEGYFRLTAFNTLEKSQEATMRILQNI